MHSFADIAMHNTQLRQGKQTLGLCEQGGGERREEKRKKYEAKEICSKRSLGSPVVTFYEKRAKTETHTHMKQKKEEKNESI